MTHGLPPIEEWWPTLAIEHKHRVLENPTAPLDREVLDAIRGDEPPTEGYDVIRLTPQEQAFIRDQTEPVD